MSFSKWQLVCIEELVLRAFNTAEACGQAHVYLHRGEWLIKPKLCNDMADDHVVSVVDKVTRRHEIEVKALRAMLAEVAP